VPPSCFHFRIKLIENLIDKADGIIICGGMAYTFLKQLGCFGMVFYEPIHGSGNRANKMDNLSLGSRLSRQKLGKGWNSESRLTSVRSREQTWQFENINQLWYNIGFAVAVTYHSLSHQLVRLFSRWYPSSAKAVLRNEDWPYPRWPIFTGLFAFKGVWSSRYEYSSQYLKMQLRVWNWLSHAYSFLHPWLSL